MSSKLDRRQRLDLLGLPAFRAASPSVLIKLDEDENPLDWPAELKAAWAAAFIQTPWNRYPPGHLDLQRAIADPLGLEPAWVSLGAGADEVLRHVLIAWCLRGTVVYPVPTHPTYGVIAQTLGLKHVAVMLRADFTLPVEQVIATALHQDAAVILIGNPNNPTGNLFVRDELLTIARETDALVVVDERSIEYSGLTLADALSEVENLAVIRSFSHGWPAADFRLACLLARPRVIVEVEKVRLPHNVSGPALLAGQILLSQLPTVQVMVMQVVRERDTLRQALTRVSGAISWPSAGNFLLVGTTLPGDELASRLLDRDIAVRPCDRSPLMNCIRVTVGTREQNTALVTALQDICGQLD